jgi:hypothetical protein
VGSEAFLDLQSHPTATAGGPDPKSQLPRMMIIQDVNGEFTRYESRQIPLLSRHFDVVAEVGVG